jgi:REP element-mobilizing transposase RayT
MDAQHTKHVTYTLAYHFVWCPTYRKKILVGKLATFLEQEIRSICETNTWTIGALSVQTDHVHLFRESRLRMFLPHVTGPYPERHHRTPRVSTLPRASRHTYGAVPVTVSFVLRG